MTHSHRTDGPAGPLLGQRVGDYVLDRLLGEGGMGAVYLAHHVELGQQVAIKALFADRLRGEEAQRRFLQEARVQAELRHPGIVAVLTAVRSEGRLYLVMEYIEGASLFEVLTRRTRLSVADALPLFRQILDAVGYMHDRGIIHRDLKPENVLVTADGHAKVTDLGLVLVAAEDNRMTQDARVLGTPHYMSPEQVLGSKDIDHRSDIYALGAMLFEMLTGQAPFEQAPGANESDFQVKHAHVHQPPPDPCSLVPALNLEVRGVVLRALSKSPSDRFQTCREFASWLDAVERVIRLTDTTDADLAGPDDWTRPGFGVLDDGETAATTFIPIPARQPAATASTDPVSPHATTPATSTAASKVTQPQFTPPRPLPEAEGEASASHAVGPPRHMIHGSSAGAPDEPKRPDKPNGPDKPDEPGLDLAMMAGPKVSRALFAGALILGMVGLAGWWYAASDEQALPASSISPSGSSANDNATHSRVLATSSLVESPPPEGFAAEDASDGSVASTSEGTPSAPLRQGMIRRPAAKATVGCGPGISKCYDLELPYRSGVAVAAYYIDETEVTGAAYQDCVEEGDCARPNRSYDECGDVDLSPDTLRPVVCVSWKQANTYCEWRDSRLCTELEWEAAARSGTSSPYPWGSAPPNCTRAIMDGDVCGMMAPLPVKSRPEGKSADGVYDLAGNVWEWVAASEELRALPKDGKRLFKGGGFEDPERYLRAHSAFSRDENTGTASIGFRCCADATDAPPTKSRRANQ